jgi:hypothetical protein
LFGPYDFIRQVSYVGPKSLKGLRPIFIKREEEKYIKLRDGATARRRMRVWTGPAFAKRSSESTEALEHSKYNNGLALPYQAQMERPVSVSNTTAAQGDRNRS